MAKKDTKAAETERPNIIFISDGDAPTQVSDGGVFITLPASDAQKKGFYHADAAQVIRAFPQLYKAFVRKGEK